MKLPNEAKFAVAKIRGRIVIELRHMNIGAVYVTFRSTIKSSEYLEQACFT